MSLALEGSDVHLGAKLAFERGAALIEEGFGLVAAPIDGGAALLQRMRLCRPAIVGEGGQQRVLADQFGRRCIGAEEIAPSGAADQAEKAGKMVPRVLAENVRAGGGPVERDDGVPQF